MYIPPSLITGSTTGDGRRAATPHHRRLSDTAAQRLHASSHLQRAFDALHQCGPRPTGMFAAEMLDAIGADPAALDMVLTWRRGIAPSVVAAIGGEWPPRCLLAVP